MSLGNRTRKSYLYSHGVRRSRSKNTIRRKARKTERQIARQALRGII